MPEVEHNTLSGADLHDTKAHRSAHVDGGADEFSAADILNANVKGLRETAGPTSLRIAAVADGEFLKRSGVTLIGASAGGTGRYVPRNADPAAADFTLGSFTTDGTWRDLDLSSIVPANAIAVTIRLSIQDDTAGKQVALRRNGNVNGVEIVQVRTQVANISIEAPVIVSCDANRVIEYNASSTVFTIINMTVLGWFI